MIYKPKQVKISKIKKQTSDEYLITINENVKVEPGQFVQVSILGVGEAPISVSNYGDPFLELNVRVVGNVTRNLCMLKPGDTIGIRGPYGNGYELEKFKGNNVVVVGGGCGVAPIRAVLKYVEKHREQYKDVYVFLGFRSPKDVIFKKDIKVWQKKFNLELTVDKGDKSWKGKVGLITKLIDESGLNNHNKIVFVCGPPIMIKFVAQSLNKLGFNDDQIIVSLERHMKCGLGRCGHCMVHGSYVCKDGPVYRWDQVKDLKE
jgi:anaerobic sulfite reductase subunit B